MVKVGAEKKRKNYLSAAEIKTLDKKSMLDYLFEGLGSTGGMIAAEDLFCKIASTATNFTELQRQNLHPF